MDSRIRTLDSKPWQRIGIWFVLLVFSVGGLLPLVASADIVPNVMIRQVVSELPNAKVYVDFTDQNKKVLKQVSKEQLKVTIGNEQATVDQLQTFTATGEGVRYVVLIDVSAVMGTAEFEQMLDRIDTWIKKRSANDRISIMTFAETVRIVQDFSADKTLLSKQLGQIKQQMNGSHLYDGLIGALDQANRLDQSLPKRRAVIAITDGDFELTDGGKNKLEFEKQLRGASVPFYMIGAYQKTSGSDGKVDQSMLEEVRQERLKTLAYYGRYTRGDFYKVQAKQINAEFDNISAQIERSYALSVTCEGCKASDQPSQMNIELTQAEKKVNDTLVMAMSTAQVDEKKQSGDAWYENVWLLVGGGVLLLVGGGVVLFLVLRKKPVPAMVDSFGNDEASHTYFGDEMLRETQLHPSPSAVPGTPPTIAGGGNAPAQPLGASKLIRFAILNDEEGPTFEKTISQRLTIGRKAENDIALDDNQVSGLHCEIQHENGIIRVLDLGSTNGTYVNGVTLHGARKLESGDVITVGRVKLRILF